VDHVRQHFYEVSLEYVFKVQEVQERKMFEFVEPVKAHLILLRWFFKKYNSNAKNMGSHPSKHLDV